MAGMRTTESLPVGTAPYAGVVRMLVEGREAERGTTVEEKFAPTAAGS